MKRIDTYKKDIAKLRARLPHARNSRTANCMNWQIRELAAVMRGLRPGAAININLADAVRITGEADALSYLHTLRLP